MNSHSRIAMTALAALFVQDQCTRAGTHPCEPYIRLGCEIIGTCRDLSLADINADGHADIVVCSSNNVIVILPGTGNGFAPAMSIPTGDSPFQFVIADLDHDGRLDIATVSPDEDRVSVHLGGTGFAFQELVTHSGVVDATPSKCGICSTKKDGSIIGCI